MPSSFIQESLLFWFQYANTTHTKTRECQNHVQNSARKKIFAQNSLIFCSFVIYATTVHNQLGMEVSDLAVGIRPGRPYPRDFPALGSHGESRSLGIKS